MIDTAVIMAAGKGTRFGSKTHDMPKGFIPFKGTAMVVRSIESLIKVGIKKIIIGTGYHKEYYEQLTNKYPQIETVFSPFYAETNSMETLSVCKESIGNSDFLLLESDIVYEERALTSLINEPRPNVMLVSPITKFQDQYYIGIYENSTLAKCSTNRSDIDNQKDIKLVGELVGIHKISNNFYRKMLEDYSNKKAHFNGNMDTINPLKRGYEFYLEDVTSEISLGVVSIDNLKWYEIDDDADLKYAETNILIK